MAQSARFALADWGTTRLRVWLSDAAGTVIDERRSDQGMAVCRNGGPQKFADVFESELTAMGASPDLPAVISGMAGARGGWREAAYMPTPAPVAQIADAAVIIDGVRPVAILPGVSQNEPADVMRGEEVQIAGSGLREGWICLPGTHSKWVWLESGRIVRFTTFMTGELFSLLSRQSILTASIDASRTVEKNDAHFIAGVRQMVDREIDLSAALFSIRAGGILHDADNGANAARLSGLLIGAEVAAAKAEGPIRLIADDRLGALYAAAFATVGREYEVIDAERATRQGLIAAAQKIYEGRT
ncbi:2-dehydro-3-deoxygalactonokinase [Notoacmeibacter sp. MSK16QG-6]|uniref:2-dehydro-3-deoxygalactonokinase n=1 Tax=Notoacmeibacter sp. MSK16QG-6 TaxID=2957982 RepID=UPI00209E65B9|nr:2-dehydro-3-deoxygalactonokinase [Notoacmeibacter sp. MSK16QG-6]MCP1200265.1 2-dehydro-3-deoxygalactonokinase [Notoacmeibacter sp. MSK16QG-6]